MPFSSHAIQAFAHLQQVSDELLQLYLHHAIEPLLKNHPMTCMFKIPAEGLNHYTLVYGLNSNKLKDKVEGHQSAYWNIMEDCFSDTHTFGAGYKGTKGYCKADFNAPEAPVINEVKSTKEPVPCFKCGRPHFCSRCTKNKGYPTTKF